MPADELALGDLEPLAARGLASGAALQRFVDKAYALTDRCCTGAEGRSHDGQGPSGRRIGFGSGRARHLSSMRLLPRAPEQEPHAEALRVLVARTVQRVAGVAPPALKRLPVRAVGPVRHLKNAPGHGQTGRRLLWSGESGHVEFDVERPEPHLRCRVPRRQPRRCPPPASRRSASTNRASASLWPSSSPDLPLARLAVRRLGESRS